MTRSFSKPSRLSIALFATLLATSPVNLEAAVPQPAHLSSQGTTSGPDGAAGLCRTYPWACASAISDSAAQDLSRDRVRQVNLYANHTTPRLDDQDQYGVTDFWTLPSRRGGDCEDFALFKKQLLLADGANPRRLLIAVVLDRQRKPHAVLVYRTDEADLVLDNLTDTIKPWHQTGYVFLSMQDPQDPSRWVFVGS